ncbi:MAG TPA: FAD:protein FMN transferase [Gemmataceae bacterium]|nr:FAD:protein FMN transferase [Gemmataceae bacterium]
MLGLAPPGKEISLLRCARRAMATVFEVLLPYGRADAQAAAEDALDLIDRLEAQLTVYRPTSEVSRLNRLAELASVPVEAGLFDLLAFAARLSEGTGGAFDITAGPLIKAWGFYRRQGRVPEPVELAAALGRVGMSHVELNPERRSVRFRKRGMEINLGSIGKGYALDRAAVQLWDEWGVRSALLHGGTSSVLAIGTPPGEARGWAVGIKHPWAPARRLAIVRIRGRALATSGATFQNFEYNGRKLGHLLDPRTGRPAEGVALATAFAPAAAEADALATAFYILGVEPTRRYCETHPDVSAMILPDGADAELEVINLPSTDFDRADPAACDAIDQPPLELA